MLLSKLLNLFKKKNDIQMDKYLIVGLGNPGAEYVGTRHNTGYMVLDAFAEASNTAFEDRRYGFVAETSLRGRKLFLLKPTTYMNLSGNAVRYWMQKENIPLENVLIIVDDLSLEVGAIRIKQKGSEAGHNGLRSITACVGSQAYARLRFGIGNDFPKGAQVDFVLGRFNADDEKTVEERAQVAIEAIKTFCLAGINITMNQFNNK